MVMFADFLKNRLASRRRTGRKPPAPPVKRFPAAQDLTIKAKLTMPVTAVDVPELSAVYLGAGIAKNTKNKPRVELKLSQQHFCLTMDEVGVWIPFTMIKSIYTVKTKSAIAITYLEFDGSLRCVCLKLKCLVDKQKRWFSTSKSKITGEEVKQAIEERMAKNKTQGALRQMPPPVLLDSDVNDQEVSKPQDRTSERESLPQSVIDKILSSKLVTDAISAATEEVLASKLAAEATTAGTEDDLDRVLATDVIAAAGEEILGSKLVTDAIMAATEQVLASRLANQQTVATEDVAKEFLRVL